MIPGLSNLSYPERLRKLKLPTLAYRRLRGDMIQVFKLTTDSKEGYDNSLPSFFIKSTTELRGHSKKLYMTRPNKDIRKYNFSNRIIKLWNNLPDGVVNAKDMLAFEKGLDKHWEIQELKYDNFKASITL